MRGNPGGFGIVPYCPVGHNGEASLDYARIVALTQPDNDVVF